MSKITVVTVLALALAGAAKAAPQAPPTIVFVLAGQSNMVGHAYPVPAETPDPRVMTLTHDGQLVDAVDPLGSDGHGALYGDGFGPSLPFAQEVLRSGYERVVLLMCAVNGTGMNAWVPGGYMYDECVARTQAAQQYGRIGGLIFMQGETDAFTADAAANWSAAFGSMVFGFRDLFGWMPVVYGQIGQVSTDIFPYRDLVQQQQANTRIACASMVPTSDLALQSPAIHFTGSSYQALGVRLADAWLAARPCSSRWLMP